MTTHLAVHYENHSKFEHLLIYGSCQNSEREFQQLSKVENKMRIESLGRQVNFLFDLVSVFKLYRTIKLWKPDIIETHAFKPGLLICVLHPFISRKIQIIHHYHGHLIRGYFNKWGVAVYCWIEKIAAKSKDCLTTDNLATANDLVSHGIGYSKKFVELRNGVEAPDISLQNSRENIKKVSFVGRFVDVKSPKTFIEVARLVKLANPKINFEMVGEGPLEKQLKMQSYESDTAISFKKFSEDLYSEVLSSIDLLLVTSLNEGMPLIIQQANYCGIPVISTPVGGIPDIVLEGVNGYCEATPEKMALRILQLLQDPSLTHKLSLGALNEAKKNFGIGNYVFNHELLITNHLPI